MVEPNKNYGIFINFLKKFNNKNPKLHSKQWSGCKAKVNCMHTRLKFTQPLDVEKKKQIL
jgi:hypothetical protein